MKVGTPVFGKMGRNRFLFFWGGFVLEVSHKTVFYYTVVLNSSSFSLNFTIVWILDLDYLKSIRYFSKLKKIMDMLRKHQIHIHEYMRSTSI